MGKKAVKKVVTKTVPRPELSIIKANTSVKFDYHNILVKVNIKTGDDFKEEDFKTRSTYGKEGAVLSVDDPFTTHPAWTGALRNSTSRVGRLADFKAKFGIENLFDDEGNDKEDNSAKQ